MDVSFYRPTTVHSGFYPLGDYVQGYLIYSLILNMNFIFWLLFIYFLKKKNNYQELWFSKG